MSKSTMNLKAVYTCDVCGNSVELLLVGGGKIECCKQPMTMQVENTVDAAREKHIPVIERIEDGVKVTVGSVPHPMTAEHYIAWIEIIADGVAYRRLLQPGEAPEAIFSVVGESVTARAYCNLHGLWKGE